MTGFTGYSVRHSVISHPFVTPWTTARQAPLSMGFSRQGHWSGLPFPPPEALPRPGMEPGSPALQADSLLSEPPGRSFPDNGSVVEPSTEPACQGRRCRFDPWMRKIPGRRKWLPTPVFLPGEFHGQRSLVGCNPWGPKESDTTKQLNTPSLPICSEGQK